MKRRIVVAVTFFIIAARMTALAQQDSVIIRVGAESKVVFIIKDKRDLETLKHYDFQALMDDMVKKLDVRDTSKLDKPSAEYLKDSTASEPAPTVEEPKIESAKTTHRHYYSRRTYSAFTMDFGTNNYLEDGKFPDSNNQLYTVKPWGSWYVALNSVLRTRVTGKFFVEWGAGVSWYNFKFLNEKTILSKDDTGAQFSEDTRDLDFSKSKLTVTYINLSVIPLIDFGGEGRKTTLFDGHHGHSFRIGVGPYAGYRIDSYTKQAYFDNGDKHKTHNHDNFYLNNIRYGLRMQLGFRDTDIFFNYDMNELFTQGKGPKLNAFSFGISL